MGIKMYNSSNYNNNCYSSIPLQKIRCAIYTRKSNEKGLELEYNSIEYQYDACLDYIREHQKDGWIVVNKRYDDGGFSGGTLKRPAMHNLIDDIELGLIDKVVIYKLDRISRRNIDYYKLDEVLARRNVEVEIMTQHFDKNTSMGRFSFNMMLSYAQLEREMSSDRVTDKKRKQQSLGMWTGGTVPLGYDVVNKKLLVNVSESKIVKTIFNTFIETKSINETINILNDLGYKTKVYRSKINDEGSNIDSNNSGGNENSYNDNGRNTNNDIIRGGVNFNRGSLYHILNNKLYIGKIENKVINKVFDGLHEAIIDEETFNQIQEIFKTNLIINVSFF